MLHVSPCRPVHVVTFHVLAYPPVGCFSSAVDKIPSRLIVLCVQFRSDGWEAGLRSRLWN